MTIDFSSSNADHRLPEWSGWKINGNQVQCRQSFVAAGSPGLDLILYIIFKKGVLGPTKTPTLVITPSLQDRYDRAWLSCEFNGHPSLAPLSFNGRLVVTSQGAALTELGAGDAERIHLWLATGRDFQLDLRRGEDLLLRAPLRNDDGYARLAMQMMTGEKP